MWRAMSAKFPDIADAIQIPRALRNGEIQRNLPEILQYDTLYHPAQTHG
jgi:hypothetical protein